MSLYGSLKGSLSKYLKRFQPESEPIVGWRAWDLNNKGILTSSVYKCAWPPQKAMAIDCVRTALLDTPWHKNKDYGGGIHAFKNRNYAADYVAYHSVIGGVYLWGKVIEHEDGYRAEFAYPKELFVPEACDPITVLQLEENYGVPVSFTNEFGWFERPSICDNFTGVPIYAHVIGSFSANSTLLSANSPFHQPGNYVIGDK